MAMLSGKDAAIIANAVYTVLPAKTTAQATNLAQKDPRLAGQAGTPGGPALSQPAKTLGGVTGKSGAVIKDTTGFGVVMERGTGINREVIVAIRGTQTGSDWVSNFNVGYAAGPAGSLVHSGFMEIYKTLQSELHKVVRAANAQRVHFVGHSLGGALATLAAVDFAANKGMPASLYTFGAPRVGSLGLTNTLRTKVPAGSVKRIYSLSDPVPMIPLFPYVHYGAGASGINANFNSVTATAHSMTDCYIPNMPASGWPPEAGRPNKANPDYWLDQAEKSSGLGSAMGYFFLGKALEAMLPALHAVSFGMSNAVTVLDYLASGLVRAAMVAKEMGERVLRFARAALRIAGKVATAAATEAADLTRTFLRYVLNLLLAPVKVAARTAVNMFS